MRILVKVDKIKCDKTNERQYSDDEFFRLGQNVDHLRLQRQLLPDEEGTRIEGQQTARQRRHLVSQIMTCIFYLSAFLF